MRMPDSPGHNAPDFRLLFESAPGSYLVLSPNLQIVAVSDAYLRATMTQRASILGRRLFEVFPDNPADLQASGESNLTASLRRVLADGRPNVMAVQKYDIRRPESEGGAFEERYWSPANYPVAGPDGQVAYIIHKVEDVTAFVRLQQEGSEREKITADLTTRMETMGAEVYRRAQEIQVVNRQLRELQTELEARVEARGIELQRAHEDLQRTEEQFRQNQKLEAIGRLAGGIAHDFNNLLLVIMGHCEFLEDEVGPGHPMRDGIAEIRRAGERAANLTRQLLAFSRQQVLDPTLVDLNEIVAGMHGMLARLIGEDIELRTDAALDLGLVLADRGQIEQVLMNLVVNARDAMPDGGTITITTANIAADEDWGREHGESAPGAQVLLAVRDTGIGMDRATEARVFEPFFTTKERGKGTGLGLSTVFGIVKQSAGTIRLESAPGAGTTFSICFPRAKAARETPAARPSPIAELRGTETILLAEDDEQARAVVAEILNSSGYRVLAAQDGEEALQICRQSPHKIDLLVTDVIMQKVNGRDLAARATSVRPQLRVLFMSGYTDDVIVHHGVLEPGVYFLQKPFSPEALALKVREVLGAPPVPRSI
ncbi:MAG: response regulator [Planctomycetes bacterium]|nr:response regulator [Planctomycetota bacterium]